MPFYKRDPRTKMVTEVGMPFYKKDPDTKLAEEVSKDVYDAEVWGTNLVIASDTIGPVIVKTKFLGFDHTSSIGQGDTPKLWRTFANGTGPGWPPQLRYTSEAAALVGHGDFCAAVLLMSNEQINAGLAEPGIDVG